MTNEERMAASIDQIYTYGNCQYTKWRIAVVRSIQKMLLNLDDFYADILPDIEQEDNPQDVVHCQIRNGWFYEAVSQAEQAIEDLFSTIMNLVDLSFFAKKVVHYNPTDVKKYIWDFKADDLEYVCAQFGIPYFSLTKSWEHEDVFEAYKQAVLDIQKLVREMKAFHLKYYQDYCQYKHGLSVALIPMQNPLMKNDVERREKIMKNPLENGLETFHQGTLAQYQKINRTLPAMGILLKPAMQKHVRELHDEGNLLFFTTHVVRMEEVVSVVEHAGLLLDTVWQNILWRCEEKDEDKYHRVAFPAKDLKKIYEIGFPKDE